MFKKDRNTDGPFNEAKSSKTGGMGVWFKENQRTIVAVGLIVIMAFVMRFVFSFGVSADSAFALSGGTIAAEHLHTITEILSGGSFFGSDGTLYYPFGSTNTNPVFIDLILAGIASIGTALGMEAAKAASLTLSTFSLVCGTFAVIPMFLLGKEVLGTKKAGYLAAMFLAFCPVVITQTVFSNGTETGWILLLFLVLLLIVIKGVKAINTFTKTDDSFKDVIIANRSALRFSAKAGLVLALIVLSTSAFRPIFVLLIIAMAVMTVVGRFQYKDVRMVALFFSAIITIGILVAAAYYLPAKLWDQVLSGIFVASVLSIAVCMSFAALQNKPWVVTVPAYLIGVIVVLVLVSTFAPDFYADLVRGNTVYADALSSLTGSSLSISQLSADFGVVTMWLSILVIGIMIWRIPKNISSISYQFLLVFMIVSVIMTAKSSVLATIFSPVYALCFAAIILWVFDHVDYKTYFLTIKNAGFKNSWRKILKPVPFVTLLAVAGLICVPIAMYAVDASIPTNSGDDYDGMDLGATGYYVKTDSEWIVKPVLSTYKNVEKDGALVTWIDYADDAATYGKFKVITDPQGFGSEAVANILLSDAGDGSANAAMLAYLLSYTGLNDSVRTALIGAGLSATDYEEIVKVTNNPSDYRAIVVTDPDTYGALKLDVSDENVRFAYIKSMLAVGYPAYKIADMYSAISALSGKNISYFMVDGNLFPMYFGYSSLFSTMAYANGYVLGDAYGTVDQFMEATIYSQYYGLYLYKDALYDTLLWRTYIGMSPAEAGLGTDSYVAYTYFNYLSLSDGKYKAQPGYGLSNFEVDYDHWYVMYNPDNNATVSGDGWVKMLCTEAIEKQDADGGLINYLSGLPVFLKYVPNSSGTHLTGIVKDAGGVGVGGVRVSVVDAEGTVRSTAHTGADGSYDVLVTGDNPQIKFYAGSANLSDGTLIKTVDYTGAAINVDIPATTATGIFVDGNGDELPMEESVMTLTGQISGRIYHSTNPAELEVTVDGFELKDAVPDIYTVTLTSEDGKASYVSNKTIKVYPGENKGYKVALDVYSFTVKFVNDTGATLPNGVTVWLRDTSTGESYHVTTEKDGTATVDMMIAGTYICTFEGEYVSSSAPFTVSKESKSATVQTHASQTVNFNGFPENQMVTVYSSSYQTAFMSDDGGAVSAKLPRGNGGTILYTAYAVKNGTAYMALSDGSGTQEGNTVVSGKITNVSNAKLLFTSSNGYQIPVSVAADGSYSVILKSGLDYTIYANNGSKTYIEVISLSESIEDKNIELVSGDEYSVYSYWGKDSYATNVMAFVPVTVSNITGLGEATISIVTGANGVYRIYLPDGATCDLTATCKDPFYYDAVGNHTKTETEVTTSTKFVASIPVGQVENTMDKTIKIGDVSIEAGHTEDVAITGSTWTIEIEDDDFYSVKTVPTTPGMAKLVVSLATFDETQYYMYKITGTDSGNLVTITPLDEEEGKYIDESDKESTTKKYWVQDGKTFMFTITDSDSTKIMYETDLVVDKKTIDATTLSNKVDVTGYIGINEPCTITAKYSDTEEYDFDFETGRYSIALPADKAVKLIATVQIEKSDVTYNYGAERDITAAALTEAGTDYVCNLAVVSEASGPGTDKITAEMTIDSMTDDAIAEVEFTVVFTNTETPVEQTTYALYGGSGWSNVVFYNEGKTAEISIVTFSTNATIHGKGTVVKSAVAFAADGLSVTLVDINGNTVGTAKVTGDDTEWSKTPASEETTKIDTTTNTVGDSEYMFSLKIVNDDNFTKRFVLTATGVDTEKWFLRYAYDNIIKASTGEFDIKGYTTATVYVKIISSVDDPDEVIVPESVTISVAATGANGMSTESADVTIEGNNATAISKSSGSTITVEGNSASGRGVLNAKSDIPTFLWLLIAIIVAMVFLIIWMASKRGVFTRRK